MWWTPSFSQSRILSFGSKLLHMCTPKQVGHAHPSYTHAHPTGKHMRAAGLGLGAAGSISPANSPLNSAGPAFLHCCVFSVYFYLPARYDFKLFPIAANRSFLLISMENKFLSFRGTEVFQMTAPGPISIVSPLLNARVGAGFDASELTGAASTLC